MFARILTAAVILVAGLASTGCTGLPAYLITETVSGPTVTRTYDIIDFDGIQVETAFNIAITQGDTYAVSVTVDEDVIDRLVVEKEGSTLKIGFTPGLITTHTLQAEITMPQLGGLQLSGASTAALSGFSGGMAFRGQLSGASRLTGDMSAARTVLDLSGASQATLRGESDTLDAKASGASKLNLGELTVRSATIELSGASSALIHATEEIDATASGASTVTYIGNPPSVREDTSGASTVKQQ
jgi:hypothetical protein